MGFDRTSADYLTKEETRTMLAELNVFARELPDADRFAWLLEGKYARQLLNAHHAQDAANRGQFRVVQSEHVPAMRAMGLVHYGPIPTLTYFGRKVRLVLKGQQE